MNHIRRFKSESHRFVCRSRRLKFRSKGGRFDIIAAVEMDSDAGATYRHNIGNHTEIEDITKFSPKRLRKNFSKTVAYQKVKVF